MRVQHLAALLLLAFGIAVGSQSNTTPDRVVPRAGEFVILAGDFHVHAFPGDGSLAAFELRREAAHAGLDVFAVTNHNQTIAARLVHWLAGSSDGPIVIVGQEVTNPRYHLIAVGITRPIDYDQPAARVIADIHAQGGVAIAAHPEREYWDGFEPEALDTLDGVEAAHPVMHEDEESRTAIAAFFERARQRRPNIAAIGSSDFHASPALGAARTFVLARERSEAGVLEAIRAGRTVAEDGEGQLYGDPALVRLVEANRPAGRSDPHPRLRRIAVVCAWLGVVGLVLFAGARGGPVFRLKTPPSSPATE